MSNKIFIGNCKVGKYPDQVDVGFTKDHLDLLYSNLNEKGWVNCRVNKGKDSGKPYMELVQLATELKTSPKTEPTYTPPPPKGFDDLPF